MKITESLYNKAILDDRQKKLAKKIINYFLNLYKTDEKKFKEEVVANKLYLEGEYSSFFWVNIDDEMYYQEGIQLLEILSYLFKRDLNEVSVAFYEKNKSNELRISIIDHKNDMAPDSEYYSPYFIDLKIEVIKELLWK